MMFSIIFISKAQTAAAPVLVTFQVDMSTATGFTTPELNGNFNSWCGSCAAMSDFDGDNIWDITILLSAGSYEFKYSADNWGIEENLYYLDSCTNGNQTYTNRTLTVTGGDTILPVVCWSSCDDCSTGPSSYNVTFEVDMRGVNDPFTTPEVNGEFNLWCGSCWPMSDNDGDSIWQFTTAFAPGDSLEWKYSADNWSIQENIDSNLSCITINYDSTASNGWGYVNRVAVVNTDTTFSTIWNYCGSFVNGCTDVLATNYNSLATVDDGSCVFATNLSQIDLPITWDDTLVDYTVTPFGGTAASLISDPLNTSNTILAIDRTAGSPTWAGTTLGTNLGFATNIPLTLSNSTISVNIWSPQVGTPIRLKVEDSNDPTHTCETELNTTAVGWQVLVFDFTNEAPGTESLSVGLGYGWIYNKASIFCDFGNVPLNTTKYYLDDINFGSSTGIVFGCTDSLASNYDPLASIDDGSCITCIYGCMDSLAINYDSVATCQDNSCIYPPTYGCTDSLACNFSYLANIDDGSCGYIVGCIDSLAFNYDSLSTCSDGSCLYEYNVTFQLDLRNQTSISYTTPELNGDFNNWCGDCAQMTDLNNDSIWEITIPLLEGTGPTSAPGWLYKFSADNWSIEENLFSGSNCVFTSSGYSNRFIEITQDTILDPVCWESCEDCFVPQSAYNVTFQLDMTNVSGFSVPEVNGEFNGWCGNCWSMTDVNGDDIWEFTTLVDTSLQQYKFSADNWSIQENLDSSLSCVLINYDSTANNGWGYVNRYLHINSDTILAPVCWQDCLGCSASVIPSWNCDVLGNCIDPGNGLGLFSDSINCILNCQITNFIEQTENDDYLIYPNPTNELIYIKSPKNADKIIIYNTLGEVVYHIDNPSEITEINFLEKKSDIYFVMIYNGKSIYRDKIFYIK